MENDFALLLILAAASAALCAQNLYAQNQPPVVIYEASHCLVTGDHGWLDADTMKSTELTLGYQHDAKTLLGDDYIYLIVYTTAIRDRGKIFDIRIQPHHQYRIENSASFVMTSKGVDFPKPPDGGQWEQTQFAGAVQHIWEQRWYTASMKYLLKHGDKIRCEAGAE